MVVLFVFVLLMSVSSQKFTPREAPEFEKIFLPQEEGWLGGDVSTSIFLSENKYLWIWGDTLVGNLYEVDGNTYRNITRMPHNSLAIVNMDGDREPVFYIPETNRGQFYPRYETNPNICYWVIDAAIGPQSGKMFLLAMLIELIGDTGFQQLASDLIIVDNPQDAPTNYIWNSYRIPSSNANISWTASIAHNPSDNLIYIIGQFGEGQALSRISENALLDQDWNQMQFWTNNGWNYSITGLTPFFQAPFTFTETTLLYHPYLKKWYIVCSQAFQSYVYVAYADELTGPWTTDSVYVIPPPWNSSPFISYAAKSHPEFQTSENQIVFTYNTNSLDGLKGLVSEIGAYHPHFIVLTIT